MCAHSQKNIYRGETLLKHKDEWRGITQEQRGMISLCLNLHSCNLYCMSMLNEHPGPEKCTAQHVISPQLIRNVFRSKTIQYSVNK